MEIARQHILFLCSWYPHPEDPGNGIFIRRHAQALALRHHVTVVFARSAENLNEPVRVRQTLAQVDEHLCFYPKVKTTLPLLSQVLKFRKFRRIYRELLDELSQQHFDIIHVNTVFPAAIPARDALSKFASAKLFITEHWSGYYPEDGAYRGSLLTYFTKRLVAEARAVMVISEKLKQAMNAHGLRNHYQLIHNCVDTGVFRPSSPEPANDGTLQILHVSSLTEREKNISGIIEIANLLRKAGRSFHLTLIGANPHEEATHKALVNVKSLSDKITFTGRLDATDIAAHMNRSDVFLLFSHFEGAPVVVSEALSCGLPVISTDVGQVKAMIPEGMGLVLANADPANCAQQLLTYNRAHFAARADMHQYVAGICSPEAVCREISACYQRYT